MIGIAITGMIGAACAVISTTVATGWKASNASNTDYLTRGRTTLYLQSVLRGSKQIGICRAGSLESPSDATAACVLVWRADLNGDEKMQLKEVALVQHSVADSRIMLYQASFATPAIEATANATLDSSYLTAVSGPEIFKANPYVSSRVAGNSVIGVRFDAVNASSATQRPSIEFLLKMSLNGTATYEYGSATLRPPKA